MPRADLEFPTAGITVKRVRRAEIVQREYQHDVARITVTRQDPSYPDYRTGTPMRMVWGDPGLTATFYGYVHHVEPNLTPAGSVMEVVCVGASWPLKQRRQRVYRDMTASDVARKVAEEHRLAVDIEKHAVKREVIAQAGESDWELLVRLAKDIGYVLYVNGTTLHFHSRIRDIFWLRDAAQVFRYRNDESTETTQVASFISAIGEMVPGAEVRADRWAAGVNPRTKQVVTVRNNGELRDVLGSEVAQPWFDHFDQGLVVHDKNVAETRIDGITESSRFHIRAEAQVVGNVRVRQAVPVFFDGLPADYGGAWFVHSIRHVIVNMGDDASRGVFGNVPQTYTANLELGRDSMQIVELIPGGRPRREDKPKEDDDGYAGRIDWEDDEVATDDGVSLLSSVARFGVGEGEQSLPDLTPTAARSSLERPVGTILRTTMPITAPGERRPTLRSSEGYALVSSRAPQEELLPEEEMVDELPSEAAPPAGARRMRPPEPVAASMPKRRRSLTVAARSTALWQATFSSQPERTTRPAPRGSDVAARLAVRRSTS